VLASLVIIAVALVWTFGLMGILRMPLSVVTSIIPVILFPIGVATAIHVFRTHARLASQGGESLHVIETTFDELMKPILLSAITTFVGFASFSFSHTLWTRTFGIFTGVGVALALAFSIVLLPIVLWYQRGQASAASQTAGSAAGTERGFWHAYSGFVFNPLRWFVLVAAILVVGVVGILRVRMEGNPTLSSRNTLAARAFCSYCSNTKAGRCCTSSSGNRYRRLSTTHRASIWWAAHCRFCLL
jgi:predicted RND superfamily exporter protein